MSYLDYLIEYLPKLGVGAWTTVLQMLCASALAIVVSLVFGLLRLQRNVLAQGFATVYIEFFRGTSLLVQLYWIYYVLPLLGLKLEAFASGFIALGLNFGAYGAEIVRGAIQAVPRSQWEAAIALNMSPVQRHAPDHHPGRRSRSFCHRRPTCWSSC